LFNAEDWKIAREKAKELRAQGMTVEIVHNDGQVVPESEDSS
jgi:biotin operon repressor